MPDSTWLDTRALLLQPRVGERSEETSKAAHSGERRERAGRGERAERRDRFR